MTREQIKELRSDIKRANQRLRELEKRGLANSSVSYRYIEKLAYDDDKAIGKTGNNEIKFKTALGDLTHNELVHLQTVVDKFLTAKTSTYIGYSELLRESREKFQQKTGQYISEQDYAELWTQANVKTFMELYGSKEVERLIKTYGYQTMLRTVDTVISIYNNTNVQPSIMSVDEIASAGYKYSEEDNPFL